jgi:hypothetical protein
VLTLATFVAFVEAPVSPFTFVTIALTFKRLARFRGRRSFEPILARMTRPWPPRNR